MRAAAVAVLLLVVAAARAVGPGPEGEVRGPCAASVARFSPAAKQAAGTALADLDAYRNAWRAACDPSHGPADLAGLLGDAEALVDDVRLAAKAAQVAAALQPGDPWPLPGMRRAADGVAIDREAFAAMFDRGTAEDVRFVRALFHVTRDDGEPIWLGSGAAPTGVPCVRLGEVAWVDVVEALGDMERAQAARFAQRTELLHQQLLAMLQALARGGDVCACVRGDPLPALDALGTAGGEQRRRFGVGAALASAAADAAKALRDGKTRVSWLRQARDGPATGCAAGRG